MLKRDEKLVDKIAENIDYLFSNLNARRRMSKRGINKVNEKYSSKDYLKNFFNIVYDENKYKQC